MLYNGKIRDIGKFQQANRVAREKLNLKHIEGDYTRHGIFTFSLSQENHLHKIRGLSFHLDFQMTCCSCSLFVEEIVIPLKTWIVMDLCSGMGTCSSPHEVEQVNDCELGYGFGYTVELGNVGCVI